MRNLLVIGGPVLGGGGGVGLSLDQKLSSWILIALAGMSSCPSTGLPGPHGPPFAWAPRPSICNVQSGSRSPCHNLALNQKAQNFASESLFAPLVQLDILRPIYLLNPAWVDWLSAEAQAILVNIPSNLLCASWLNWRLSSRITSSHDKSSPRAACWTYHLHHCLFFQLWTAWRMTRPVFCYSCLCTRRISALRYLGRHCVHGQPKYIMPSTSTWSGGDA